MSLASPIWLLIIPLVLLIGVQWPQLGVRTALRWAIVVSLALLLARPTVGSSIKESRLWLLVDRSASAGPAITPHLEEWEGLIRKEMPTAAEIQVIEFAETALLRAGRERGMHTGALDQSRIGGALRFVLSQIDPRLENRILLLSDGFATDSLRGLDSSLTSAGVVLDLRLTALGGEGDVRIDALRIPPRTRPGEPFLISAELRGPEGAVVPYLLTRNGAAVTSGRAQLLAGRAQLMFSDRLPAEMRVARYRVEIQPAADPFLENNVAEQFVQIDGQPVVLLLSGYADDPLEAALREHGLRVQRAEPGGLRVEDLHGVRAVLINNLHAARVSRSFVDALPGFVKVQGGGLIMFGGRQSFGSGGYFSSAIDELLPVSMELKQEHRKARAAIVLVLDRSGSMGMSVAGNMGNMTKMDLANEGAARTVALLSPEDELALLAVDSEPHQVIPLTKLEERGPRLSGMARSVTVGGGGIYVFTGLKAAWEELQRSGAGVRHIVLFSDAADSEEPGEFRTLLAEMREKKVTVSVIGLGSTTDPDAGFLQEVAELGSGRSFFVDNAVDLPAVFAQETVSAVRSQFVDSPTAIAGTASWMGLASSPLSWPSTVGGFNRTYLRQDASAGAVTADENKEPLLAFWRRGAGRAAAVTFPVAGEFSETIRAWGSYRDFVGVLSEWVRGRETPAGVSLHSEWQGDDLQLRLLYSADWEAAIAATPPSLTFISSGEESERRVAWERAMPGRFEAKVSAGPNDVLRGAVQIGEHVLPFGPFTRRRSTEFNFDQEQRRKLLELAKGSGGTELLNFNEVWRPISGRTPRSIEIPLLILLVILALTEVLLTRLNYSAHIGSIRSVQLLGAIRESFRRQPRSDIGAAEKSVTDEQPPSEQVKPAEQGAVEKQRALLARAKRRGM